MATLTTTTRKRAATKSETLLSEQPTTSSAPTPKSKPETNLFASLKSDIVSLEEQYEELQKHITQTRETWTKEQSLQAQETADQKHQEEVARQREIETYTYDTSLTRKKIG